MERGVEKGEGSRDEGGERKKGVRVRREWGWGGGGDRTELG